MSTDIEFEVKFLNINFEELRKQLKVLGAKIKTPERYMRRVVYGCEANEGMLCTYGRVRDEGDKITMSAKYVAQGDDISSQKEGMIIVDSFESAVDILEAFGLHQTNYQENKRETWEMPDGTLVELDTWPLLPPYIEIEGANEESIQKVAISLGMDWPNYTLLSTEKLYVELLNKTKNEVDELMKNLRFNN